MHDIRLIRDDPQAFDQALARRGLAPLSSRLLELDDARRAAIQEAQTAQERRNALSKEVGEAMRAKDVDRANALKAEVARLKETAPELEQREKAAQAALDQELAAMHDRIKLASLTVIAGTHGPQRATMKLDIDGQVKIEEAEGNGPVDAVFNCIKALVPHEARLELYQVHAVTQGTDAQAEVSVRLSQDGRSMTARAADPDTLVASAKAYLGALNKLVMKQRRDIPIAAAQ